MRDRWEGGAVTLFSEHSDAYSGTLPPWGMTRNGELYERPTWAHRTSEPACSSSRTGPALLRTPCAAEAEGGPLHPDTARERGQTLRLTGQILALTGDLLPTPDTTMGQRGATDPETVRTTGGQVKLADVVVRGLLPTPRASEGEKGGQNQRGSSGDLTLSSAAGNGNGMGEPLAIAAKRMAETNARADVFGVYAPAIHRWEQITGHPAPPPTEPTGRGGAHRLSARFAEWMMGLEPGWVTDIPISRTDQLRAIGNGVLPRQAVAALHDMRAVFETTTGGTTDDPTTPGA